MRNGNHSEGDQDETESVSPRKSAPRKRNLQDMLDGDIPELKSNPAQIRHRVKRTCIKYFGNMAPGEVGVAVVVPAAQQAELVLEHTECIPPGLIAGMLEALQKQLPRDKRIKKKLEEYKRLQAAVKSRGALQRADKGRKLSQGTQRSSKGQHRAASQDDEYEDDDEEGAEMSTGGEDDPLDGLQDSEEEEEEEEEEEMPGEQRAREEAATLLCAWQDVFQSRRLYDKEACTAVYQAMSIGYEAVEEVACSFLSTLTEDEWQTLPAKHVLQHVAAQLKCDYTLIKHDVRHVIDQYLEVFFSEPQGGDAEAEAAGDHVGVEGEEMPNLGDEEQDAVGSGGEVPVLGPQGQDASGCHSSGAEAAAATGGNAVAAVRTAAAAGAAVTGQQQRAGDPEEAGRRPQRAAAARVAAAVCAAQDDDGAVRKRNGNSKKGGTLPEGYTEAGLASREKCLWDAKLDKDRAAIVKRWADEAGRDNAPVAELVSAAKFAVALANDSSTKQFKQQATTLKNYMQNCPKFSAHFSAGRQPAQQL